MTNFLDTKFRYKNFLLRTFYDYIKSWDVVLVYFEKNHAVNGFLDDYDKSKK